MQKINFILILLLIIITGCSRKINQYKDGKESGLWIWNDSTQEKPYRYRGRYKKGIEKGKWKYFWDDTLIRTERYKNRTATVKYYYPDGRIKSKGRTQLDITPSETHWYYFGDWLYYNTKGKLTTIRTYRSGQLIKETEINNNGN